MVSVLFVCLGNICRSPTAEGVFTHMCRKQGVADSLHIDSAGTAGWHAGKAPDARAVTAAALQDIDLSALRARQVSQDDFSGFDYILAMDEDNLADLRSLQPDDTRARVDLFLDYAPGMSVRNVPDPYYGGDDGFVQVLELVRAASAGLLTHLIARGEVKAHRD